MIDMPEPGEIRIIDGKEKMWLPTPPPQIVSTPITVKEVSRKKTLSVYRENFLVGTILTTILSVEGAGELRELSITADKKINIIPKVDGNDLLYGRNTFDEIATTSAHSRTVEAKFYDPDYAIGLSDIHFLKSLDIQIWTDSSATVSSLMGMYDVYGDVK